MIVREILMSSLLFLNSNVLSFSTSTRTPNDDTKPLDYELMAKLEKTNGSVNYLFKKDWERELGEPYIDNVVKFKYKSKSDVYAGFDLVEKESKNIFYKTYNIGFYDKAGWGVGVAITKENTLANFHFGKKFKKDDLEYFINISAKTNLDENQIFNVKSDVKKWITKNINIFGLYKHEYYNGVDDFQFKVGLAISLIQLMTEK